MSSEIEAAPAYFADFRKPLPKLKELISEMRCTVCQQYLQADLFTYGGETLVIAYPQPPRILDRSRHTIRLKR